MPTRNHLYSLRPAVLGFILGALASAKIRHYYGTFKASTGPQRNLERPTRLRHLLPLRHAERLVPDRASFRSWVNKWAALFARTPAQNHSRISPPALVQPLPEEEAPEGPFDTNGDTGFYEPQQSILLEQESLEFPDTVTDLVEAGQFAPSPILEDLDGPGSFILEEDADGDISEIKQAPRPPQRELAPDDADGPTISCVKNVSTNLWFATITLSGNNHRLVELLGRLQTIIQESIDDDKPIDLVIKLVAGEEMELAQRLIVMHHILNYTGSRIHDLVLEVPNFAHPNVSNPQSTPSILLANMNFPMLETLSWFGRIQDDLISQSFPFRHLTILSLHCAIAVDDCGELLFNCRHQLQKFTMRSLQHCEAVAKQSLDQRDGWKMVSLTLLDLASSASVNIELLLRKMTASIAILHANIGHKRSMSSLIETINWDSVDEAFLYGEITQETSNVIQEISPRARHLHVKHPNTILYCSHPDLLPA